MPVNMNKPPLLPERRAIHPTHPADRPRRLAAAAATLAVIEPDTLRTLDAIGATWEVHTRTATATTIRVDYRDRHYGVHLDTVDGSRVGVTVAALHGHTTSTPLLDPTHVPGRVVNTVRDLYAHGI